MVRASFDDQRFREAALIFGSALTPADFQTAFQRLEEQSRQLEAAQVGVITNAGPTVCATLSAVAMIRWLRRR